MTIRLGARVMFLSLLGATACGGGDDLLLGQAELTGDAGSEPMEEDAGEPPAPSPAHEFEGYRFCGREIAGRPQVELSFTAVATGICDPPCELQVEQMRVSDDGSIWLAGSVDLRERLWISHFDARGALLGATTVPNYSEAALLAIDDDQQAWLAALDPELRRASNLYRFDGSVRQLSKHSLPTNFVEMIRYPGNGLLLSGVGQPLLAIDLEGRELWSTAEKRSPGRLSVDERGQIVLVNSMRFPDARAEWLNVEWFTIGGSTISDAAMAKVATENTKLIDVSAIARGGEVTLRYGTTPPSGGVPMLRIARVDQTGSIHWRWAVEGAGTLPMAIDPLTGTILTFGAEPMHEVTLIAISPDGRACRRFALERGPSDHLSFGPNGDIWMITRQRNGLFSVTRLERPDLRW